MHHRAVVRLVVFAGDRCGNLLRREGEQMLALVGRLRRPACPRPAPEQAQWLVSTLVFLPLPVARPVVSHHGASNTGSGHDRSSLATVRRYGGPVTVYAIAQLTIHDRERYDRYANAFMPILHQYGGRLLAADEKPVRVEGEWDREKLVLMEFPDRDAFQTWSSSPEYREIASDRIAGADTVTILVRGLRLP
jgi:uncharacterized protein (DUF1330 family)